jgi:hypothetical protein
MLDVLLVFVIIHYSLTHVDFIFTINVANRLQSLILMYIRCGRHTECYFGLSVQSLNFLLLINFLKLDSVKMTAITKILHLDVSQTVICFSRA